LRAPLLMASAQLKPRPTRAGPRPARCGTRRVQRAGCGTGGGGHGAPGEGPHLRSRGPTQPREGYRAMVAQARSPPGGWGRGAFTPAIAALPEPWRWLPTTASQAGHPSLPILVLGWGHLGNAPRFAERLGWCRIRAPARVSGAPPGGLLPTGNLRPTRAGPRPARCGTRRVQRTGCGTGGGGHGASGEGPHLRSRGPTQPRKGYRATVAQARSPPGGWGRGAFTPAIAALPEPWRWLPATASQAGNPTLPILVLGWGAPGVRTPFR